MDYMPIEGVAMVSFALSCDYDAVGGWTDLVAS
jgi:hypothetical protein